MFIIIETIRKHKDDLQIWSIMESINLNMNRFLTKQSDNGLITYFALVSVGVLGFGFVSELFIIGASYKVNVTWTKNWLVRFSSNQMIRFSIVHYLFYVVFIMDRMKKIRAELQDTAEQSRYVRGPKSERVIQRRVRQAQKTHQLIRSLKFRIEERFGCMILATMANYFVASTACWYYVVSRVYYGYWVGIIGECGISNCNSVSSGAYLK
ncbi:unnamed protein product [Hermetia illucens]|uniref:Gustatory receptor n=1 Tax=Hermetia illucens TaxID=343691 RepID=A0A7R8YY16_HERIL|nr:unnamed protein product [Hermetia illucens]